MTRKPDDKGLLNEVLPDPTAGAGERGTPRERTASHLNRLLAAAGLALAPGLARADTTTPKPPGDSKPTGDKATGTKPDAKPEQKPEAKPEPPGYGVVDPLPDPYIQPKPSFGFLKLASTPPADISVDGVALGLKTPQKKIKLTAGIHTVTLKVSGSADQNFSVEIKANSTVAMTRDLRPAKNK